MINFYMYSNSKINPFIIMVTSVSSIEEMNELNDNVEDIFDFLFKKSLVNLNNILIFNVYKTFSEKKEFFMHKGPNAMDPEIIGKHNLEKIVFSVIRDLECNYEIIIKNNELFINNNNKNLNFLCNYW